MQIEDMSMAELEAIQRNANETMTTFRLVEHEMAAGSLSSLRMLTIEPVVVEIPAGGH